MDPFDGIEPGMRWEDEGGVWEVETHGTAQNKPTEYDVVYYLPEDEDRNTWWIEFHYETSDPLLC